MKCICNHYKLAHVRTGTDALGACLLCACLQYNPKRG